MDMDIAIDNLDKTTRIITPSLENIGSRDILVTIFDTNKLPETIHLDGFEKNEIYFGRGDGNDIVLTSKLVSRQHGRFRYKDGQWIIEDAAIYGSAASTNGLICYNRAVRSKIISDGDLIRIDDGIEAISEGVLLLFSSQESDNKWSSLPLGDKKEIRIGRAPGSDIFLPSINVSKHHADIIEDRGSWYIVDLASTNGVLVNDHRISGVERLHEKDVIVIANSKLIFSTSAIYYCCFKNGISIEASELTLSYQKLMKQRITVNKVSLDIKPGELVAIVGGSGAGKSTLLKGLIGSLPPADGEVYINGANLYRNYDSLKYLIGYVPQSDIVYDDLTLYDMLLYTAKLRLPKDVTLKEREEAIDRVIRLVELTEKKHCYIRDLSGGQKKRASIAIELLSDPNLLFLDEPASGLDPGTEKNLMAALRKMADSGKTVILVTHSTLQLHICDKIAFMGAGGNLCFFGSCDEALRFFGVSDVVDIYEMISKDAKKWRKKYDDQTVVPKGKHRSVTVKASHNKNLRIQFPVLCSRYLKLVMNHWQRLLFLLLLSPILTVFISGVADGCQFEQLEMTKSLLFALSCAACFVGLLNSIQEVCKERSILKREHMAGLSLTEYILSKALILGLLCFIQSLLMVVVFSVGIGLPKEGMIFGPFVEMLIGTFLTTFSSTAMGLFVSSVCLEHSDLAMALAPGLLLPQLLFSGILFELEKGAKTLSLVTVCRWSMEGFGTVADLNELPLLLQQQGILIPREAEDFFEHTRSHLLSSWGILILLTVIFLILARIALIRIRKEIS